jgi:hypothetical protein
MSDEKQTIVLEDHDSAIVLSADGNLDMYLPDVDFLPETGQMILSIAMKLHDEDFRDELIKFFDERAKEVIIEQEELTEEDVLEMLEEVDIEDILKDINVEVEGSEDDKVL